MSSTTTGDGSTPDSPMDDSIVDVLGDARSRRILDHLADRTRPVGLNALARVLVESTGLQESEETTDRIAVELHHLHLPKMQALGLIDYDACRRVVAERPAGGDAGP